MAEGFKIAEAFVDVVLRDNTDTDMERLRQRVKNAKPFQLPTELKAGDEVVRSIRDQIKSEPPVEVPAKLSDPVNDAWKSRVRSDLAAAAREINDLPINADTEQLRRGVTQAIRELEQTLEADIPIDAGDASALRAKVRSEVDAIERSIKARVPVEVDDSSLRRVRSTSDDTTRRIAAAFMSAASSAGGSLGSIGRYAGIGLGAIPPLAIAGAAAIAAIGPAAIGAAGMIASIGFAWGGVIGALKGYAADQKAVGAAAGSSAATQLSNAIAIRDATRAITDAKRDQVQAYEDAADLIASAERRVEDAHRAETDAQEALTAARKRAADQLADLQRRVDDAALSEEGASLAVESAQERLKQVLANPLSSDLEKRRADYDVRQAQARLEQLREDNARTRQELDEANARGIEGDEQVIDARERLADANRDVIDAEKALGDAHQEAAEKRRAADERVALAIEHLADVQAQQAASAGAAGGATSKFAEAMAKLTPEARALVEQLISMKPLIDDLSKTAQQEMLPGFTKMFKDSEVLFPIFKQGIAEISGILGDTAARAGDLFQSPVFQGQLAANFANGAELIRGVSDTMLQLFADLIEIGAQAGPVVDALAGGLRAIGTGLGGFFDAIAPAMGPMGDVLRAIFQAVAALLGPLGQLIAMFAEAFAPVFRALVPVISLFAEALLTLLAPVIEALGPLLTTVVQALEGVFAALLPVMPAVGEFFAALGPLLGVLAEFVGLLLEGLAPVLKTVAEALTPLAEMLADQLGQVLPLVAEAFSQWWQALSYLIEPITQLIIELLPPMIDLFLRLLEAFEPIWPAVVDLARVIADELVLAVQDLAPRLPELAEHFMKIVEALLPHVPMMLELAGTIATIVIPAIVWIIGTLMDLHTTIFGPIFDAIAWLIEKVPAAFQWIADRIRDSVNTTIDIIDWFSTLPGRFQTWFASAKDAAIGRLQELINWVRGLPGELMRAVGDLGSSLYGQGQNFVRGLWNGIASMGSWLYNAVWNWVKAQLPGPVKDALGIRSPSKVAEELAAQFPAGIVVGLDGGSGDVQRASLRLADAVQSGLVAGGDGASLPDVGASTGVDVGAGALTAGNSIHIENFHLHLDGVIDLTDPYAMDAAARQFVVQFREALRQVEASQT